MKRISENTQVDQILVEKVIGGDTNSFSLIIKNTEGLVTQIIYKMISNKEDRKDIAQDVYLKAFRMLKGFRFQAKLSTWIGKITYNTCVNYLEKKKLIMLDDSFDLEENEPASHLGKINPHENETENLILNNELSEVLATEIEKLPPIYKTLITLYHNEEMSYPEMPQITGLPEGTIKSYLFRARKKLRDNLLKTYKKEIS